MKKAVQIVFRCLTSADFYNINKPRGSETSGGGQTYIDFPVANVSAKDWMKFFSGLESRRQKGGPFWVFEMHSLGLVETQYVELGQRRPQTFSIRRQTLGRKHSNRVLAWHPKNGFPKPKSPRDRSGVPNLVVYAIRTVEGEYWAGWFQSPHPKPEWQVDARLLPIFKRPSGSLYLDPPVMFDESVRNWPFRNVATSDASPQTAATSPIVSISNQTVVSYVTPLENSTHGASRKLVTPYRQRSEDEVVEDFFAEDIPINVLPKQRQVVTNILRRNQKIVKALKELYGGRCQISGEKYTFKKSDGSLYCEAHHLVPLGAGGADSPYNVIVVSPLIHRMIHFAEVSGLDLSNIKNNKLEIKINGEPFTITWHPKHAELVNAVAKKS
jgi:5-methylcytosine-specific restriction protein A